MHTKLTSVGLILLSAVSCKIFKTSADKFISYDQQFRLRFNLLMAKIHNDHWNISLRYGDDCPTEHRDNTKELEKATTTVLQGWLQPLRALPTIKPIVNDFRYQANAELASSSIRITFYCTKSTSNALLHTVSPPDILIRRGTIVNPALLVHLTHEVGHAFGLADTYVGRFEPENKASTSSGGLNSTVGKQPPSIMNLMNLHQTRYLDKVDHYLSEDDKRGIIWLYKYFHEGLELEDCFFPDYVLEREPLGCRPKYPLIFEVKHSDQSGALQLLDEDPSIAVNAQNVAGMTALHYAVMYEKIDVVKRLLKHKDINPALRDKQGRTALDIAREANLTEMIALLQAVTPLQVVEDVNDDGVVNILDLVVVTANFGKKGKNRADVDGSGTVDILDLVRVAGAFGDTASSAPLNPEVAKLITATHVNHWLTAARQQTSTDPAYQRGVQVLERLLARITPQQTALLANYPNPFNADTWLPYKLASPSQVTISIYAASGKLVRTLALGHVPAGVHQSKNSAAYWDGKNAQGEAVASGVYFYTLSAGGFTATRKMLLRK